MHGRLLVLTLGLLAGTIGCSGAATYPQLPEGPQPKPNAALVARAAGLAFGTRAVCDLAVNGGDGSWTYSCHDQPYVCDVANDGQINRSAAHSDCWSATCTVTLGVHQTHDPEEPAREDFYACQRTVIACTSYTGGCPNQQTCVTGHGRTLEVNELRTEEWYYATCPFSDEASDWTSVAW